MNAMPGAGAPSHFEMSSPTLLAAQPPTTNAAPYEGKDWGRIYDHLESSLQGYRMWRYSRWVYWADLAKYVLPFRYTWLVVANKMWRDRPINNAIIDNTGTQAMWVAASGLWTGLTSPSRPWFKLGIGLPWVELDQEGKEWLEDTQERLYIVFGQSNFYTIMAQFFQDVLVFGSAPIICYEDAEDVARFYLPCAGEYYLGSSARFAIDTLFREFVLTVKQVVDMFGLKACPPEVRKLWEEGGGSWSNELVIGHAIEPNVSLSPWGKFKTPVQVVPKRFPYREVYWLKGQSKDGELSRKGFFENPFAVGRWKTVSNDPYGRALAEDILGDIKQLQLETVRKAEFLEKLVRPPMVASVEMKNEPSSIIPGHVTYTDSTNGRAGFKPAFEVAPQALAPMIEDIKAIQQRIKDGFFENIFMAITQMEGVQPRNELELTKRDQERLQVLGPFISQFETDTADPIIQRVLSIMQRRGLVRPKPQSLQNVPLKIEYNSILRLAQSSAETVGLKDFLTVGGQMTEAAQAAGAPAPLRNVDLDKAYRKYGTLSNIDPSIMKTQQQVQREDAAKKPQQMAQHAAQMAPAASDAANAAQSLATTPMGGNTALAALLGGGGGPAQ